MSDPLITGEDGANTSSELLEDANDLTTDFGSIRVLLARYIDTHIQHFLREASAVYNQPMQIMRPMVDYLRSSMDFHIQQIDVALKHIDEIRGIPPSEQRNLISESRLLLRVLRQTCGSLLTASRWQAHAVVREDTAFDPNTGLDQINDRSPWPFNYSRWYSRLVEDYEDTFCREYYPDCEVRALLTNSGMSAIEALGRKLGDVLSNLRV